MTGLNASEIYTAERVFREFGPRVYALARRMLGNDADAEDVTQEVILQVVRKLDTFRGESALPTWLHRITVNAALALRRKRSSRGEQLMDDPLDRFDSEGRHTAPVTRWFQTPEQQVLDRERANIIEQAISELPEVFRDVYILADVEDLPNSEIASIMDLSIAAVKSRLHRARLMMREKLSRYFGAMGEG